MDVTHAKKTKG